MVAIVTGNGLGLVGSSANVLGAGGQLGAAGIGQAGEAAYVNAKTGNLTLQHQDELLIGRGPDIGVVRTYNSNGTLDFDNNDRWQLSLYRQLSGLTGTVNTAGSTITRTGADGAQLTYTYDATSGKYINKDGAGSYDTLTYTSASNSWSWVDGNSGLAETYNVNPADATKWRITSTTDTDGNALTYTYDATTGVITQITDANGEKTQLIYNAAKQLTQINVIDSSNVTTTRVRYTYDSNTPVARLATISTDLTPAGGSIADGKTYTTTYTYDGTSTRIASITNSDGTKVSFTYDTSFRVKTIVDGTTTTTITYNTGNTVITDASGQATTLTYDAAGQLTRIQGPTGSGQDINYSYDANGNVTQSKDSRGNAINYTYDTFGNLIRQQDAIGNVVERSYNGANQLMKETVYAIPDPDGAGTLQATVPQTTYYVRDAKQHLRFIISPEGRVTEYRYDSYGQQTTRLTYTANTFNPTTLASWLQDFSLDASGLSTMPAGISVVNGALQFTSTNQVTSVWPGINGSDKALGTVWSAEVTTPATITPSLLNIGIDSGAYGSASYLRHRILFSSGKIYANVYVGTTPTYTLLGTVKPNTTYVVEIVTQTDGSSTAYVYEKGLDHASGIIDRRQFSGWTTAHLSMETFSGATSASGTVGSTATIIVDNLRSQLQPRETDLTAWLATVSDKTKTERTDTSYDSRGLVKTVTGYSNVDATGAGVTSTATTTQYTYDQIGNLLQSIDARGVATTTIANDYVTTYTYDGLNRLTTQTDALGNVTTTAYNDATHQVVVTLANGLSTTSTYDLNGRVLSVVKSDVSGTLGTTSYLYDALGNLRQATDPLGQKTYYLYDSLNRQVGVIDATNALTETVYNNDNQVIRTIRYASAVTATLNATTALINTLATTGIRVTNASNDRTTRNLYDAAGRLAKQIDALGAVTEYTYDGASRLVKTTQYANLLTATQLTAIAALSTELLPGDSNTIPVSNATSDRVSRNLYRDDGLLLGTLDGEGYLTEYTYDAAGRKIIETRYGTQSPSAQWASGALAALRPTANSALDQTKRYLYNAAGQLTGQVDAENYLTTYSYDLVSNLTSTTRYKNAMVGTLAGNLLPQILAAAGTGNYVVTNSEDQTLTNTYDADNRLLSTTSQPDGLITTYVYDSVGNLSATTKSYTGAISTDQRVTQRRYNSLGQVTAELSGEGINVLNTLISPTQAQKDVVWNTYGVRYAYDLAGRRISMTEPKSTGGTAGNKTLYYYDNEGKLTYHINALGEVTEYRYNLFDQQVAERHYNTRIASTTLASLTGGLDSAVSSTITGLVSGGYSETLVGYNQDGQAISLTDALGNVSNRSYNTFGQLASATDKIDAASNLVTSYGYDRRGLQQSATEDATGVNRITQAIYDAFGRVTQTTNGLGGIVKHSYDRLGREVTITDALNAGTATSYDAFGRVLTVRDRNGNTTAYSYNSANRTMTMTTAEGVVVTTEKNRYGETVKITDGRNNVTTYTYNADGKLSSVTTPDGGTTTNSYVVNGPVIYTTDARGTDTWYSYDAANRVLIHMVDVADLALTTQYRYDAQGRATWVLDANKDIWTRTDFDAKGQVTAIVVDPTSVPDATGALIANAAGLNLQTTYTYDARGKQLTVTVGAGTAQARTTQYLYDKLGRLTQTIVDPHLVAGDSKQAITTSYVYDKNDNVVLKTDANGNKTVYTYDANNRLVYTVDALGNVTRNDYDANGNLLTTTAYATPLAATTLTALQAAPSTAITVTTNAADQIARNVYDKNGRRTFTIDAAGNVTQFAYDAAGNVIKRTRYANAMVGTPVAGVAPQILASAGTGNYVVTSANDQIEQTVYDAANRATYSIDATNHVTAYSYDVNGNVTKVTRYANAMVGTLATNGAPQILAAAGTGNYVLTSTNDQVTTRVYDTANRVTDETRGYGSSAATTTHYGYDALGHQTSITEAYGTTLARTTTQEFDTAGRKTAVVDALANRTSTQYDALGNIVKVTDARGNVGYFYNDALGRVTLQVDPEGYATTHSYDALGNETQTIRYATKITGTLTPTSVPTLTTAAADQKQTFTYDKLNRKIGIQTWWGTGASDYYTEAFTYDAYGNVKTATARNGAVTTYIYDVLNRKVQETLPIQSRNSSNVLTAVVNTYAYDVYGNLITKTEASGLPEQRVTTYQYNTLNRQTKEIGQSFTAFDPATQTDVTVTNPASSKTYDARGNVTTETDARGNVTYHYYDLLDRETGRVDAAGTDTAWTYDATGNKTSQTVYANAVKLAGGAVLSSAKAPDVVNAAPGSGAYILADGTNDRTTFYTYDTVGHQTGTEIKNITTGSYNTASGQYTVVTGSLTTSTDYDALGNVVKQTDANGNITRTWVNKAGQTVAKLDATGYLTVWTRDATGNIAQETRYANPVKLTGTATFDSGLPEILSTAPTSGNHSYVLTDSANDRTTVMSFDRLNRVVSESVLNVVSGSVNATGVLTANAANTSATTSYQYDGLNHVTQKTDAMGQITNWTFDGLGRNLREIKPTITDYTGASVRPETDREYDGLGNVKRELQRGTDNTAATATNSGQVETDDHITVYEYTNGRLSAETNATGARTEYKYDANGNITKKTLKNRRTADQVIANTAGVDDITTYTYDALNRQSKSTDVGTGLISEVQYDSFNEITGKRSYALNASNTTAPAANAWQETASYDRAGRLWKSNSGDGVTKVYVDDKNGNATLAISGTLDMSNMSLTQVLNQKALDSQNNVAQQTLYTFSVFDVRNQLVDTLQPSMTASHDTVVIQANTSQSVSVPTVSIGSLDGGYQISGTNPTDSGTVGLGGGSVSWSGSYSGGVDSSIFAPAVPQSAVINVVVPTTLGLGSGTVKVEITATVYRPLQTVQWNPSIPASTTISTQAFLLTSSQTTTSATFNMGAYYTSHASITNLTIRVTKSTSLGDLIVANQAWTGTVLGGGAAATQFTVDRAVKTNSGTSATPKRFLLANQPTLTSKLLFAYRPAGSVVPYTTTQAVQMVNSAGAAMSGMYSVDTTSLAANSYEFQYMALDATGNILNQQTGTFNTSTLTDPVQSPMLFGGIGRTLITSSTSTGLVTNGLQLIDQGSNAASVSLRYRIKNSGASWNTIAASSFVASTGTSGLGVGNFTLPTNALSVFANSTTYEVDFNVFDANGGVIRTVSTELTSDASGNKNVSALVAYDISPIKIRFIQAANAKFVDLSYRLTGSSGSYSQPVHVPVMNMGSGVFEWNTTALTPDLATSHNYDFDIIALDADGMVVNHNQANITVNPNLAIPIVLNTINSVAVPQVLRLTPLQSGIDHLALGYRLKDSNADYAPLAATAYTYANGTIEYRAALPMGAAVLANGLYEYRYTAYAADTVDANGDPVIHPLGTTTGDFTVAATSTTASRLDWVITSSSQTNSIHRRQSYNAFGEVISEIDGNLNESKFVYNTEGKLVLKRDPKTDITLANGYQIKATDAAAVNPETAYTYDLAGHLVAVKDANGNLNTQVYVAGSDDIQLERHADGGTITRQYDLFGNQRQETDEAGHTTDYSYDAMDRLVRLDRPQRVSGTASYIATRPYDLYSYDAAGQRISHTDALNHTEKMDYDSLGRITKTTSFQGFATSYSYTYLNAITGLGGIAIGGWQKTTTRADGKTQIDKTDVFSHLTWHQDLGGHQFTYNYNRAGWLTSQTGTSGQNIEYGHYANGYIQSIWDKATGTYTRFEYDNNGNRTFEGYITLKNPIDLTVGAKDYYEYANISYDSQNRIVSVTDPKAVISYEYDAAGNRRRVYSVYHDGVNGAMRTQDYWYSYDQMNRFLVTMGTLSGGARATSAAQTGINIVTGSTGIAISYNFAGQRKQAINGSDGSQENYTYTADGYLEDVNIQQSNQSTAVLRSRRINDALGRITTYNEYNAGGTQTYTRSSTYDNDNRVSSESGTDGNTSYVYAANGGELTKSTNVNDNSGIITPTTPTTTTTTTYYAYQYWDEAKQFAVTTQAYDPSLKQNNSLWKPGYSNLSYDVNGHLAAAVDVEGNRSFRYVSNAQGQILLRDEIAGNSVNRVQRYYYVDGNRVGDVGNDGPSRTDYVTALAKHSNALNAQSINGNTDKYANFRPIASADFDQNYEPISPIYPGATATTYTVKNGDTLQSIAKVVWGDSAMWYLLADANGLDSTQALTAGMSLTIPNKVTNIHNNSSTYRVYNPGEAIGDTSPTLPDAPAPPVGKKPRPPAAAKKKGGCGGIGSILVMIVAVVATIYTAGAFSAAIAAQGGALSAGFGATMTAGVGAMGSSVGLAMGAAAVGNLAGQITGNLVGVQSGFSFSSFATSVLSAGITQGALGSAQTPTALGRALSGLGEYGSVAARAVVGNVINQGVGNLTGSQHGFSWSSVAAAGVGAAAGYGLGKAVGGILNSAVGSGAISSTTAGVIQSTAQGLSSSVASQLTSMALEGGKFSWSHVAINGISAGVGYLAGNWGDVKNGSTLSSEDGMLSRYGIDLRQVKSMIANGPTFAANGLLPPGTLSDTPPDFILLPTIEVRATRLTGLTAADLAEQTADQLMSLNGILNSLNQTKADNAQFYRDGEVNAPSFGGAYMAHLGGLASNVGLDTAIGAVKLANYATSRGGLVQDLAHRATMVATNPIGLVREDIQNVRALGRGIANGVREFANMPYNEKIDAVAKGGLGLLAGGAGSLAVKGGVGVAASMTSRFGRVGVAGAEVANRGVERSFLGSSEGHLYAQEVLPGGTGTALTGHGEYVFGSGEVIVPRGTAVTLPRDGIKILDETGRYIEAGDWNGLAKAASQNPRIANDIEGMTTWLPGSKVPNYTLSAPTNPPLRILQNSTTVESKTLLDQLLQPNMGCIQWAACTKF